MKMKKLSLYFLLFSFVMSAQNKNPIENNNPKTLNYEFGLNLYSLTDLSPKYFWGDGNEYTFDQNYFSGIFVKRHFNKNCIRAGYDLYRKTINENINNSDRFYQNNGNIMTSAFRLGYEREFSTKRIIPFLSADLVYMYSLTKGFVSGTSGWMKAYYSGEYLIRKVEYAISMGSGLKWKLTKSLQLSYEFSYQVGYSRFKERQGFYQFERSGTVFRINPVRQLGLSILF